MSAHLAFNPKVERQLTPTLRVLIYRASDGTAASLYGLGWLMLGWGMRP